MSTPFEDFVGGELPKRLSTNEDPTKVVGGKIPVSTGVGLEMEFKTLEDAFGKNIKATDISWFSGSVNDGLSLNSGRKKVKYNGGQLSQLMKDLEDPMCQAIFATFLGDSLTWGMTVTGGGITSPRTGQLSDTRNNLTSPTWVNLFHQWLGRNYFRLMSPTSTGIAEATYSKTITLWPSTPLFNLSSFETSEGIVANTNSTLKFFIDFVNDGKYIEFNMYGASFTYVYSQLVNGSDYELFVDNVTQGIFSTNGSAKFGATRGHNFTIGQHKIRIVKRGDNATVLRTEAIQFNKILTVKNNGIIGRSTNDWLPNGSLLKDAVQTRDKYVFIMLGTNDRGQNNQPTSPSRITENLFSIINWLNSQRPVANIVLISANEANQNAAPPYFYDMHQVRIGVASAASKRSIDMIDFYEITREAYTQGITYLADGDDLHIGDLGHYLFFRGISEALLGSSDGNNGFGEDAVTRPVYDLNNISLRGDYYVGSATLNNPTAETALVRCTPQGDGRAIQQFYPFSGARPWVRVSLQNGSWVSREMALRGESLQVSGGTMTGVFKAARYDIDKLPSVTGNEGGVIMVNNTKDGLKPCYTDGKGWYRFDTNQLVS